MHARQALFASPLFGDDIKKIQPVTQDDLVIMASEAGVLPIAPLPKGSTCWY